jgi:predicted dehydrogenase
MTREKQNKEKGNKISRRSVLAAGVAIPWIIPRFVLGGTDSPAPSDKLTIAVVGVGGMGRNYIEGCRSEQIVALCDLDHTRENTIEVFKKYPDARKYHDFREMFDKEAKNFDALIVATPDHTHTIILMAGIQLGKHIYCAKPITHNIGEARRVKQAVLKAKNLITKTSAQSSGTNEARSTTEILNSGVLGPIRELHIWCDHPAYPCSLVRPKEAQTPPAGMDWDLWIGPAPFRPYHSAYHPENWRPWWDFGSGTVADMACHTMHIFFKELQLYTPKIVYGNSSTRYDGFFQFTSTPECQGSANTVTWEYPARGNLPAMKLHWYDGGMKPIRPDELDKKMEMPKTGLLFVGEKGKLIAGYYGGNPFAKKDRGVAGGLLLPEDKFKDFQQPAKTLPRCEREEHYTEWTKACKEGKPTTCPIEFGCEMTEVALLGTMAIRTRRVLEWDSEAMKVTNNDQANDLVDPPYREGWKI